VHFHLPGRGANSQGGAILAQSIPISGADIEMVKKNRCAELWKSRRDGKQVDTLSCGNLTCKYTLLFRLVGLKFRDYLTKRAVSRRCGETLV
jgi:hypothetical protein